MKGGEGRGKRPDVSTCATLPRPRGTRSIGSLRTFLRIAQKNDAHPVTIVTKHERFSTIVVARFWLQMALFVSQMRDIGLPERLRSQVRPLSQGLQLRPGDFRINSGI